MFARSYWPGAYFPASYWPQGAEGPPPVAPTTRRARGGPWVRWADDDPPKHKTLRQIVNEMFDETPIAQAYEELTDESATLAKRAAAVVAPRMGVSEVSPIQIDWQKIQRSEKKVAQLRKLWVEMQMRHAAEMRDEEWFML
jgi:hypothetical protein